MLNYSYSDCIDLRESLHFKDKLVYHFLQFLEKQRLTRMLGPRKKAKF